MLKRKKDVTYLKRLPPAIRVGRKDLGRLSGIAGSNDRNLPRSYILGRVVQCFPPWSGRKRGPRPSLSGAAAEATRDAVSFKVAVRAAQMRKVGGARGGKSECGLLANTGSLLRNFCERMYFEGHVWGRGVIWGQHLICYMLGVPTAPVMTTDLVTSSA